MHWKLWNKRARAVLWIVVIIGIIAAMPLAIMRADMESSANTVEYVFDYRDLEDVSNLQSDVDQFIDEKLAQLKEAGIKSMSLYESSLYDLQQSGRLVYYSEKDFSDMSGKVLDTRINHTYIIFRGNEEARAIAPIIKQEFGRRDIQVVDWSYEGKPGLIIKEAMNAAGLKVLDFDPLTIKKLSEHGFNIIARFSDRMRPYPFEYTTQQIDRLVQAGVSTIIFDGANVKGALDQAELRSLDHFASLLKDNKIRVAAIENLAVPQVGMNTLAYLIDYDVVRLYSLSDSDSFTMTADGISDRFKLAAKDRNIRLFFINAGIKGNGNLGVLDHSIDKIIEAFGGDNGVINQLDRAGFPSGVAQSFDYENPSWTKYLRLVTAVAAIALITLLVGAFIPSVEIIVFIIGLIGSAGLYVLNSSTMEQALALGAAVSAPTLSVIWMLNRIYSRTVGDRRMIGISGWTLGGTTTVPDGSSNQDKWIFPALPLSRRIGLTFNWFIVGTLISLTAVPIVIGLLYNITYSLVIQQFRGVSLLHMAPLALVALYVFFYRGEGAKGVLLRIWKILRTPIALWWVVVALVVVAVGMYYLSRTGNSGQVSALEMIFRNWLEGTVGVRPRFKEFLIGHPPMILGLFLALRYRASWLLLIVGTMGQLTMISTFTHIHSPVMISVIRTLLGLGIGIVIGLILIGIWIALEGVWRKWIWPRLQSRFEL